MNINMMSFEPSEPLSRLERTRVRMSSYEEAPVEEAFDNFDDDHKKELTGLRQLAEIASATKDRLLLAPVTYNNGQLAQLLRQQYPEHHPSASMKATTTLLTTLLNSVPRLTAWPLPRESAYQDLESQWERGLGLSEPIRHRHEWPMGMGLSDQLDASSRPQEQPIDLRIAAKKQAAAVTPEAEVTPENTIRTPVKGDNERQRLNFSCSTCGKSYSSNSNLARHKQVHRMDAAANIKLEPMAAASVASEPQVLKTCPSAGCGRAYSTTAALAMHMRTHGAGCTCPFCGKNFSRPWLLQGHIRTHTGEKPFSCHICAKSFADKSNLRAHVQTHSSEKPFACANCGKAFALKSYLSKHEESSCSKGNNIRGCRSIRSPSLDEPSLMGDRKEFSSSPLAFDSPPPPAGDYSNSTSLPSVVTAPSSSLMPISILTTSLLIKDMRPHQQGQMLDASSGTLPPAFLKSP